MFIAQQKINGTLYSIHIVSLVWSETLFCCRFILFLAYDTDSDKGYLYVYPTIRKCL